MKKKKDGISRLLEFTGKYRNLLGLSRALSGISAVFILMPFICVYFASKELINTFMGNALNTQKLLQWGLCAFASEFIGLAIYFVALLCSHIVAFHTEKNLKMAALTHLVKMPLGYFEKNPSGKLRKIIDENSAQTESYIAHQMPDLVGAQVTIIVAVILMVLFDWKLGIPLLVLVFLGFGIQMTFMGKDTLTFMKTYQDKLEDMNHEAVEYVRGISVVKVFGQSVHSFKKFREAIEAYKKYAFAYTMSCKKGMVGFNTVVNASFVILVPAALLVGATSEDLREFIENFLFYVIFTPATAVLATAGSGDVLTGIVAAFLAQKYDPFTAAQIGVHLHGLAGETDTEHLTRAGNTGLIADDLLIRLPEILQKFCNFDRDL